MRRQPLRTLVAVLVVLAASVAAVLAGSSVFLQVLNFVGRALIANIYSAGAMVSMIAESVGPKRAIVVLSLAAAALYGFVIAWMFSRSKRRRAGWSIRITAFLFGSASMLVCLLVFGARWTQVGVILVNAGIVGSANLIARRQESASASR